MSDTLQQVLHDLSNHDKVISFARTCTKRRDIIMLLFHACLDQFEFQSSLDLIPILYPTKTENNCSEISIKKYYKQNETPPPDELLNMVFYKTLQYYSLKTCQSTLDLLVQLVPRMGIHLYKYLDELVEMCLQGLELGNQVLIPMLQILYQHSIGFDKSIQSRILVIIVTFRFHELSNCIDSALLQTDIQALMEFDSSLDFLANL